jgi:hypothetical protein
MYEDKPPFRWQDRADRTVVLIVWQKNKPPARQVEGVALASSKKPPVII